MLIGMLIGMGGGGDEVGAGHSKGISQKVKKQGMGPER